MENVKPAFTPDQIKLEKYEYDLRIKELYIPLDGISDAYHAYDSAKKARGKWKKLKNEKEEVITATSTKEGVNDSILSGVIEDTKVRKKVKDNKAGTNVGYIEEKRKENINK